MKEIPFCCCCCCCFLFCLPSLFFFVPLSFWGKALDSSEAMRWKTGRRTAIWKGREGFKKQFSHLLPFALLLPRTNKTVVPSWWILAARDGGFLFRKWGGKEIQGREGWRGRGGSNFHILPPTFLFPVFPLKRLEKGRREEEGNLYIFVLAPTSTYLFILPWKVRDIFLPLTPFYLLGKKKKFEATAARHGTIAVTTRKSKKGSCESKVCGEGQELNNNHNRKVSTKYQEPRIEIYIFLVFSAKKWESGGGDPRSGYKIKSGPEASAQTMAFLGPPPSCRHAIILDGRNICLSWQGKRGGGPRRRRVGMLVRGDVPQRIKSHIFLKIRLLPSHAPRSPPYLPFPTEEGKYHPRIHI